MSELKMAIREVALLLLHKKHKVEVNFTFFGVVERVKLRVFGR
jgi:hypothetical protein